MKLFIKRDQEARTGLLGGHQGMTFQLSYRLELTPQEKELVSKYKAESYPLTYSTDRSGAQVPSKTVSNLMAGGKESAADISVLLNNEKVIKDACANFKILLGVMATFGGEEVVNF